MAKTLTTSWQNIASWSTYDSGYGLFFYVDARYTSQSISNNTTTVETRLTCVHNTGATYSLDYHTFECTYAPTVNYHGRWTYESETITSGSSTVSHNSDGTKSVWIQGRVYDSAWGWNAYFGDSVILPTIPRYATCNQSLSSKTLDEISMNWSSDSTCDYVWYSLNNGSWTAVGSVNASSGSYTISGLSPNTAYSIKTRVRRKDSQLTTDSSALSVTTYNYAILLTAPDFNDEDNPTVTYSNDMGDNLTSLQICIASSDTQTIYVPYRDISKTGTSYTFNLTESERDTLLDACVNDTMRVKYVLKTNYNSNNNYSALEKTFTSTGGKVRLNVNGVWKKGTPYINVNGTWKKGKAYLNVGGTWKKGK